MNQKEKGELGLGKSGEANGGRGIYLGKAITCVVIARTLEWREIRISAWNEKMIHIRTY